MEMKTLICPFRPAKVFTLPWIEKGNFPTLQLASKIKLSCRY